jgi:hypothetical protein
MRILEDFGEPAFIDDATTVGPDRCVIYTLVDCHDGRMIPSSILCTSGAFGKRSS